MALLDFQTSLAQLVRTSDDIDPLQSAGLTARERSYLSELAGNPGFHFTIRVQRSWCAGRAAKAAYLTLSILPAEMRDLLLAEWIDSGGGTQSFAVAESEAFLQFIAGHLPEPSHQLTVCMTELASLKAEEGVRAFKRPGLSRINRPTCILRRGHYSGIVRFYAEPREVLNALINREPCPPISTEITTLVFGPGFDRLYSVASGGQAALYERLQSPASAAELLRERFTKETLEVLLEGGVVEYAE